MVIRNGRWTHPRLRTQWKTNRTWYGAHQSQILPYSVDDLNGLGLPRRRLLPRDEFLKPPAGLRRPERPLLPSPSIALFGTHIEIRLRSKEFRIPIDNDCVDQNGLVRGKGELVCKSLIIKNILTRMDKWATEDTGMGIVHLNEMKVRLNWLVQGKLYWQEIPISAIWRKGCGKVRDELAVRQSKTGIYMRCKNTKAVLVTDYANHKVPLPSPTNPSQPS